MVAGIALLLVLWLDLFAGNGPLDDRMAYGLYIARKALEATQEAK